MLSFLRVNYSDTTVQFLIVPVARAQDRKGLLISGLLNAIPISRTTKKYNVYKIDSVVFYIRSK